ncbi:MAG TPA: hypothetical protein PLK12_06305 [Prolixibacteraceae bacterium]|nr:hypothetical protein [Prolixibacteraceae bacterium]
MKKRYLSIIPFFALLLLVSCDKKDDYNYNDIVPIIQGDIVGPEEVVQTFSYDFSMGYRRGGSTWNWTAEGAQVEALDESTAIATIKFADYPASGKVTITVTETTMGGKTSEAVSKEVTVKMYCPLANGNSDFGGTWVGEDAYYESTITAELVDGEVKLSGMGHGFIQDWWAEAITEAGVITLTVNEDGSVDIPRQYAFTTDYEGAPYRYEIAGAGTWDNCGSSLAMVIVYDIYYEGEEAGLAEQYASYLGDIPYLTADVALGAKSVSLTRHNIVKPTFK